MTTMFDSVTLADLPANADAVCAYVDPPSDWTASPSAVAAAFPGRPVLKIARHLGQLGDCLDIEKGNAQPGDAPAWWHAAVAAGIAVPMFYANLSTMPAVIYALTAAGIERSGYKLWCAHWNYQAHICAPSTCGALFVAEGTQYANPPRSGGHYDVSLISGTFFSSPVPPAPSPAPVPSEHFVTGLPIVQQGTRGQYARNVQGLLAAAGRSISIDGVFGPNSRAQLIAWQTHAGITPDGICGNHTWSLLLGATVQ